MAHIIIKNVGSIKEVKLSPKKVNVLMGPQSSGKSTIAKILCHCQWIEKQTFSNFNDIKNILLLEKNFYASLVKYHRLEDYFNSKSKIEYKGEFLTIKYDHSKKQAEYTIDGRKEYYYPKISYIPSERNLVAAIPNLNKYNESNDVIMYFLYDWNSAKSEIREQSDRNIRKVRATALKKIHNALLKVLLNRKEKGYPLTMEEKQLIEKALDDSKSS